MSQVFIYTEKAKIPRTHLTALRKAGIVPVRVSSFDQARFVQAEAPIEANDMLRAAVRTICGGGWSVQSEFAHAIAALLERDQ